MKAQLAFDARATLGEGALWHDGRLLWVDIDAGKLNRFDPVTGVNESWALGQMVGTVVPRALGGFVVGLHHGVGLFDLLSGKLKIIADPAAGRPEMRCNDGKCDPRGRLFVGTMALHRPRAPGALYRVDPDYRVTCMVEATGTSNGLAWSSDRTTMYFIDTPTREVSAFDYDEASGTISGRRSVVRLHDEKGRPDGMTIDADDNLWVALYDGGAIVGCDPRTGRVFEKVEVPTPLTTSCAFGGNGLGELFVTTARTDSDPLSGGLFVARPGVSGVPAFVFAG